MLHTRVPVLSVRVQGPRSDQKSWWSCPQGVREAFPSVATRLDAQGRHPRSCLCFWTLVSPSHAKSVKNHMEPQQSPYSQLESLFDFRAVSSSHGDGVPGGVDILVAAVHGVLVAC